MSKPIDWEALGRGIGEALAKGVEASGLGPVARDMFSAAYGKCRVCDAPLGGASPDRICETCHAGEVLAQAIGGKAPPARTVTRAGKGTVTVDDGEGTVLAIHCSPPSPLGRVAGMLSARATISGYLVDMGEPPADNSESIDALRARYMDALTKHAGEADA